MIATAVLVLHGMAESNATADTLVDVRGGLASLFALIMVAVFAGMASGDLVTFQQVGFGLAVAVILDATVIRMVLVPASMELFGDWNWYLPSWLEWLPKIHIEGVHTAAPAAVPAAQGVRRGRVRRVAGGRRRRAVPAIAQT